MLQWLIRFPEFAEFIEFPGHLGKTPIETSSFTNQKTCNKCSLFESPELIWLARRKITKFKSKRALTVLTIPPLRCEAMHK